ncbi:hypothetical protein [Xylanimonas protaetiae]|uniref:DUF4760 domain-containing protein n=1 Tax=Xylanimonas protaetiae TaxID=2509457 RepID=A0A4P6FBB2_9MICO|nr:hypothetical protein [Xylanimonas protaetiae]QAY70747.1 hypothetical protein ET471_12555 [Xylanimonas protaetiae]
MLGGLTFGSAEVIATLALVASVASLFISWRSQHHSAKITTYRSATDLTLDIDHQFLEHPELRRYFYKSAEPAEGDVSSVEAMSELMLDCFECIWDLRKTYSPSDRRSWGRYILDMLDTSPAMKEMCEERLDDGWYPALYRLHQAKEKHQFEPRKVRLRSWVRRWRATVGIR